VLAKEGYGFTVMLSYRPPAHLSDAEKQKNITLEFSRLGQKLERRGQPYVGLRVVEKKAGGELHGHALLFVLRSNLDAIRGWADTFEKSARVDYDEYQISVARHARPAVETDVQYVLKQHRWLVPAMMVLAQVGGFGKKATQFAGDA
jgi:hypothetical protein